MSDQKLRIGVVGIGWYAGATLIPKLRETGRAEIVAIARRNPDRLAQAQAELQIPAAYTVYQSAAEGRIVLAGVERSSQNHDKE